MWDLPLRSEGPLTDWDTQQRRCAVPSMDAWPYWSDMILKPSLMVNISKVIRCHSWVKWGWSNPQICCCGYCHLLHFHGRTVSCLVAFGKDVLKSLYLWVNLPTCHAMTKTSQNHQWRNTLQHLSYLPQKLPYCPVDGCELLQFLIW